MPLVADRVKETTTTTGTGAVALDGAVEKFRAFVDAIGDGNECWYAIVHRTLAEWEIGRGTLNAGTLERDEVESSSNSDNLVDFGAGTKDVFVTAPASKYVPFVWQSIQVIESNVESAAYGNGVKYIPLDKDSTEQYVKAGWTAPKSGKARIRVSYAMSVANGGDVVLELDYLKLGVGDDPGGAFTTQAAFTLTPGADDDKKVLDHDAEATLEIDVDEGDELYFTLTRKDDEDDDHTGTLNVLGLAVRLE